MRPRALWSSVAAGARPPASGQEDAAALPDEPLDDDVELVAAGVDVLDAPDFAAGAEEDEPPERESVR